MSRPAVSPWVLAVAALVVALGPVSCSRPAPPEESPPEAAALRLFDLAREEEPAEDRLAACIAMLPAPDRRAAFYDALATLDPARTVRVEKVEPLPGLDRTAVDLSADLPAGGTASFTVHVAPGEDGVWRVVWFGGPEADWPSGRPGRGQGLTTSPPPER